MTEPYIDTDVLIRFITGDDPAKQLQAAALLKRVAAGEVSLRAPATVIADAVFVLSSKATYRFDRTRVKAALAPLLELEAFDIAERAELRRALDIYVAYPRLDFGDAMTVAAMQLSGASDLYSYDRDFDRVPGITRIEPGAT